MIKVHHNQIGAQVCKIKHTKKSWLLWVYIAMDMAYMLDAIYNTLSMLLISFLLCFRTSHMFYHYIMLLW